MPGNAHKRRQLVAAVVACESMESRTHLSVARPAYNTGTGFFVANGNVYDANGNAFVMKGPNAIHAWGSYANNYATIDQLAKTGANAARLVTYRDISTDTLNPYNDAADTAARRKETVERYLANGMVAVVEDHASITTDADSRDPNAIAEVTTHWLDSAGWLKQYEQGVILNIGNEWGPVANANGSNTVWRDTYIAQVARLRKGPDGVNGTGDDITNLIEIDAGGYGQDYNTLALHAQQVLDADPQHNILFSIHLYGSWRDESRPFDVAGGETSYGPWDIATRLATLRNRPNPLPLVIGEFAWEDFRDFSSTSAPYADYRTRRVLQIADQLGIGWTGWSWNQSAPATLNMVSGSLNNTAYNSNADLSEWGDVLVNDPVYGTKASARRASIFPIAGLPAPTTAGLSALPTSLPAEQKIILETTHANVPEGGQAAVNVRLSMQPTANVVVAIARASGDANITADTTSVTFTPANWDQYQTVVLSATADGDTTNGTTKVAFAAPGLLTADVIAREIDAGLFVGTLAANPTADRGYNANGTATTLAVTSTTSPQPTGAMFLKFNLAAFGGRITSAILRLFKTTASTNLSLRVFAVLSDGWTETDTNGINATYPLLAQIVANAANGYVELDVTDFAKSEYFKDGVVSLAVATVSGTATFQTREGANKPELRVTTVEAVPPHVMAAAFDYTRSPNTLSFDFDENVAASLSSADVIVQSLTTPGVTLSLAGLPMYDAATNRATFTFGDDVLPDGRYRATLLPAGVRDVAGNAMLVGTSLDFFSLADDFDHSGTVEFGDLLILSQNYGSQAATFTQGDATGDGQVDFDDLLSLAQHYGNALALNASTGVLAAPAKRHRRASAGLL